MPSIAEKALQKLKHEGWTSDILDLRLRYSELESTRKYLAPLLGLERVHCRYLPTQKSGRWSIKNPPLPTFSADCINPECSLAGTDHRTGGSACWSLRDLVIPDPGTYFIHWDWEAIEAKYAAAYSGDDEDLELFRQRADIHTWTLCKMYGLPLPTNVMNPYSDVAWVSATGLPHKDSWQRTGAKTCRFSLGYGVNEYAILEAKDFDKLLRAAGMTQAEGLKMAKAYLDSKPKLKQWKRAVWKQIYETHEVRTPLGRRKRLFISESEYVQWRKTGRAGPAGKQGLNHLAQGQVASMMNRTIIAIKQRWPESRLAFQAHDGWYGVFPETTNPWPELRGIVEREWGCGNGRSVVSTADFERITVDGKHEVLH